MTRLTTALAIASLLLAIVGRPEAAAQDTGRRWKVHDLQRPTPRKVAPGATTAAPPADAVVLFDGTSLAQWTAADGSEARWIVRIGRVHGRDRHADAVAPPSYRRHRTHPGTTPLT